MNSSCHTLPETNILLGGRNLANKRSLVVYPMYIRLHTIYRYTGHFPYQTGVCPNFFEIPSKKFLSRATSAASPVDLSRWKCRHINGVEIIGFLAKPTNTNCCNSWKVVGNLIRVIHQHK